MYGRPFFRKRFQAPCFTVRKATLGTPSCCPRPCCFSGWRGCRFRSLGASISSSFQKATLGTPPRGRSGRHCHAVSGWRGCRFRGLEASISSSQSFARKWPNMYFLHFNCQSLVGHLKLEEKRLVVQCTKLRLMCRLFWGSFEGGATVRKASVGCARAGRSAWVVWSSGWRVRWWRGNLQAGPLFYSATPHFSSNFN